MSNETEQDISPWEEIGERTPLHTGSFLSLEMRHFLRNGGERKDYEVLKAGDSVMVVPITELGDTFLIREYRAPVNKFVWSYVAGMVDEDEQAESGETAVRELEEESNLYATDLLYVGKMTALSGVTDAHVHIYIARVEDDSTPIPAFREGIAEIRRLPFEEALIWASDGRIESSHAIAATYRAAGVLGFNFSPPSNT